MKCKNIMFVFSDESGSIEKNKFYVRVVLSPVKLEDIRIFKYN